VNRPALLGILLAAAILASAGCVNRVEVVNRDTARAAWVKSVTILPFSGVDVKKFQVADTKGDEDAIAFNKQAADDYGGFPQRFSEEVTKHLRGAAFYASTPPASGFYVKGLWEKVAPGSTGMRIGGVFAPTVGGAMAEEGKVEVRFTCWLKEVGKDKETPIATFSAQHEDKDSWSGGYEVVWELAEPLAEGLAARLREVCPELPK